NILVNRTRRITRRGRMMVSNASHRITASISKPPRIPSLITSNAPLFLIRQPRTRVHLKSFLYPYPFSLSLALYTVSRPLYPIPYALRRHIRICVFNLEAEVLSGGSPFPEVSRILCEALEQRGDQLHVSPLARRQHVGKLDQRFAARIPFRPESAPAHHPSPAPEERPRVHRNLPSFHRSVACHAAAGADPFPTAAVLSLRPRPPCRLPFPAPQGLALRL